jgi:hypothetical protein
MCVIEAVQNVVTWRNRHNNHELHKLLNEPNITNFIKIYKLSWGAKVRWEDRAISGRDDLG